VIGWIAVGSRRARTITKIERGRSGTGAARPYAARPSPETSSRQLVSYSAPNVTEHERYFRVGEACPPTITFGEEPCTFGEEPCACCTPAICRFPIIVRSAACFQQ
jgi:hypothetical protein